jgi:hypothetical protein
MSSLTGEPDAVDMGPDKRSDIPTEARNLVFNSSLVMNGEVCRAPLRRDEKRAQWREVRGART